MRPNFQYFLVSSVLQVHHLVRLLYGVRVTMNMIDAQTTEWRWRLNLYDMCRPSRVSDHSLRPLTTMAIIIIILDVTTHLQVLRTRSVVVMMVVEGGTRLRGVRVQQRLMGARIVLWGLIEIEIRGVRVVVRGTVESVVGRIHLDILNV